MHICFIFFGFGFAFAFVGYSAMFTLGVMVYHTLILNMISVNNIIYPLAT